MSPFSCPVTIWVSNAFQSKEVTLGPFLGIGRFIIDFSAIKLIPLVKFMDFFNINELYVHMRCKFQRTYKYQYEPGQRITKRKPWEPEYQEPLVLSNCFYYITHTCVKVSCVDNGNETRLSHLLVGGECDHVARVGEGARPDGRLGVDAVEHLARLNVPQPWNKWQQNLIWLRTLNNQTETRMINLKLWKKGQDYKSYLMVLSAAPDRKYLVSQSTSKHQTAPPWPS